MSVYMKPEELAPSNKRIADGGEDTDDWDTDPDFVNEVGEQGQRWGSVEIRPKEIKDGVVAKGLDTLREDVQAQHERATKSDLHSSQKDRYGGK